MKWLLIIPATIGWIGRIGLWYGVAALLTAWWLRSHPRY
jgi:hypothetical protein